MYNIFLKDQALFLEEAHNLNAHFLFIVLLNEVLPGLCVPTIKTNIFRLVEGRSNDPYTFTKPGP